MAEDALEAAEDLMSISGSADVSADQVNVDEGREEEPPILDDVGEPPDMVTDDSKDVEEYPPDVVVVTPALREPSKRISARRLHAPINKDKLFSVKQAPEYKQDQDFCTKVQVEMFCCNFCQVCFESLEEIRQHLKDQPEHRAPRKAKEKPYKCEMCTKEYMSKVTLKTHMKKMHKKPVVRRPRKKKNDDDAGATNKEVTDTGETAEDMAEENDEDEFMDDLDDDDYSNEKRKRTSTARKMFNCTECRFRCATKRRLEVHMTDHSGDAEYQCEVCEKCFRSKSMLYRHRRNDHGVEKKSEGRGVPNLDCDMCDHRATSMINLREHQETDHKGEEPKCRMCGRTSADFQRLRKHFRQQHRPGKKWHICDVCGHKSSGPSSLILHMATHTGLRKYKCETCGMRFVRKYALERHNEVKHLQIRRYMCDTCGQKFGTNFALQKHDEYHADEASKQHVCQFCNERFVRNNVLRWHITYYHGDHPKTGGKRLPFDRNRGPVPGFVEPGKKELPYPCELCKRSFSSHAVRERHMRAYHSDDTSLLCKVCGMRFGAQSKYEQHVASHNGLTSHKCRFCEKEFKRDHLRQVHESEKHTGARPWKCTCCEERFISRARMYAHRLKHYGREIICEYCGKNFPSLPLKKRHMNKHTGIKEFQCNICQREYKQKANYISHMKTHSGEKSYSCDQCEERFVDLFSLRKHLQFHQDINMSIQEIGASELPPDQDMHDLHLPHQTNLPQSVQPAQHIDILQQALQIQQHEQQQLEQQQQQHQHQTSHIIIQQPQSLEQQILRGPLIQTQQVDQLQQLPQMGEAIDVVAYNCDVCGQMFLSTDLLIAHCQTHVVDSQNRSRHSNIPMYGVVESNQFY